MDKSVELLKRQLEREQAARKQAETILERKSLELLQSNQQLLQLNNSLEQLVAVRTEELEKEKHQLNLLLNRHPLPLILVRKEDLVIIEINEKAELTFCDQTATIIGLNYTEWATKIIDSDIASTSIVDGERKIKIKEEFICFQAQATEVDFRNESVFLIILDDLTERKTVFNNYIEKERAYRELVENVSDIIIRADKNGKLIYVNQTAIKITGFSNEELIGTHFTKIAHKNFRSQLVEFYRHQIKQSIQSTYFEFLINTKSNQEVWIGQTVNLRMLPSGDKEIIALSRDITDRKKAEKALILSEDKYRSIIENLQLGLLEVDKKGVIIKAYPQFCVLLGYKPDELTGKNALTVLVDEEGRKIIQKETKKRKEGAASVYEVELIRKDGSRVWVLISGAPFYNEKNEIAGTVGIHVDISERKLMESELISAKEIAESSLKSKDNFVANMSHEIRTPLNAILGMSQLLKNSGLTEKQQNYVKAIHTSSENLLTIVNDLLDFAKLESGKFELNISANDLNSTIQNVIQLWNLKIDEKGLTFIKRIQLPEVAFYLFDSTRLFGVLNNLIHNSLKFTSKGHLALNVEISPINEEEDEVTFSIEDTGIGIAKEMQELIFESFIQAESSTTRNYGGTGLGLSIVKELIEKMNGTIHVDSELGKGSTFYFTIPLKRTVRPSIEVDQLLDPIFLRNKSVLLVEDNEINRFMAQTILENWEMNVFLSDNGAEAVDFLKIQEVDIVLMDMQTPVLDGVQAAWMIRNKLNLNLPIIALSANASKNEKEKCLEAGMSDFVSKPYRQEELLAVMAKFIGPIEGQIVKQIVSVPDSNKTDNQLVDLTLLIENTNNDLHFMKKMLDLVILETSRKVNEIDNFLQEKNFDSIKKLAHSMKPSLDHVAVTEIRNLIREVENYKEKNIPETLVKQLISLLHQLVEELKKSHLL